MPYQFGDDLIQPYSADDDALTWLQNHRSESTR